MAAVKSTDPLLQEIRNYLDITWKDPKQDKNLEMYIDWGKKRIILLCGKVETDFYNAGPAKELLFDYVRYAFNKCLEDFERNFQSKIIELRVLNQVRAAEVPGYGET
jgi:hypothetical protein